MKTPLVYSKENLLKSAFSDIELCFEKHQFFFDSWQQVMFSKGEEICELNRTTSSFFVVIRGVQALVLSTEKGDEYVVGFSFDGSFSGVYDAFLTGTPSKYKLVAITDSYLLKTDKKHYDSWFLKDSVFEKWGRLAHQNLLIGRSKREIELLTLTAQERYQVFFQRCPEILKNIPQKYIASYLNMTPETLSRIRKSFS